MDWTEIGHFVQGFRSGLDNGDLSLHRTMEGWILNWGVAIKGQYFATAQKLTKTAGNPFMEGQRLADVTRGELKKEISAKGLTCNWL